ncbi:MAG: aldolase [Pseudonocardia sp.]|nr:aldolase [Pseudonocardia sp.]
MTDLADVLASELDRELRDVDEALAAAYPGDAGTRQPVHTVYVPADRFDRGTAAAWGAQARAALDLHAPELSEVWGVPAALAEELGERVRQKLVTEPIEDLRIDLEDGYGVHPDAEEDTDAERAAVELAAAVADGTAPPFTGIRFRSFEAATRRRGIRTLVGFVGAMVEAGGIPDGFVLTLPKVTAVEQVNALVRVLEALEAEHGVAPLRFEIQVETPQSVLGPDGSSPLPRMIAAAAGRCTGLHYGTYDYSASLGIAAPYQSMEHPAADHAKAVMQLAAAGTGVRLSDGSTNVMPVGERAAVLAAWSLHGRLVRRSLERGFYQGWDLHPAQLPSRFVAVHRFYREGADTAATRLKAYLQRADSGFMDEPATAVALAGFLLRGVDCGALDSAEIEAATATDRDHLAVLARRRPTP